jgi:F-type H+-transporting ATPase subunit delta
MKANHQKSLEVRITSAYELSGDESESLISALSSKLGRDIDLEVSVDEKLIGGAIIKMEDNVVDDSIKGKLEKFANNLN